MSLSEHAGKQFNHPPAIDVGHPELYELDTGTPLHRLAAKRMAEDRDLKIIITADDSETGVGKTTLAGWLAMNWSWMFGGIEWSADRHSTLHPHKYFQLVSEANPGTVILVDDSEELDARRSMQNLNVKFSWWWMLMRLKQVITILTLPSPAAIDSRLEELADVWINILRRGDGLCHDIGVKSYGDRGVTTEKIHTIEYPNISDHAELQKLHQMKEEKLDKWEQEIRQEVSDESEELGKTQQTFLAIAVKERNDVAWRKVPEQDERLTYSGEFYRQQAEELLGNE